ncbi:MAG: hypothetical protein J7M34_05150 [Anaerolineae bacterium]|nr:hypothetical protein [Anaerolineae bacterium]
MRWDATASGGVAEEEPCPAVAARKEFDDHAHWVVAEPGWQEIAEYIADWLGQTLVESA